MPSDIYAKTSSGWSGAVKKIYAKTGSSWSAAAKYVYAFINSGWTRVWPLSGIFATTNPSISRTTSSTELAYGTVLRVGSTIRGNRGVFNPNGYTISSYQYKWVAYGYEDTSDTTVYYNTTLATLSGTTTDLLITGTAGADFDKRWMTFFVTAKASGGSAYDGSSESFRYYVVRQKPRLASGVTPSFDITNPKTGDVINYSSSWDITDAYKPEASRSTIVWYKNSTATTTGGSEVQVGGYSYTVKPTDSGSYIYAVETTFNSGSDYDLGPTVGVSATAITNSAVLVKPSAPTTLTATTNRTDGVQLTWDAVSGANYYEIYWGSSQGGGPVNQSSYADFGQDNSITVNSFLDTTINEGSTRYYRVRARSSSTSNDGLNCSDWYPTYGSNGIVGTRALLIPGVVSGLNGSANGSGDSQSITLTWNAATNAERYELYYNGTGTTPLSNATADFGGTSPFITGTSYTTPVVFSPNVTYYWWVRSVRGTSAKSDWSAVKAITTNSNFLTAPTITSITTGNVYTPVSVYFSGGSGPFYQAFWWSSATAPSGQTTPDASGSSSPLTDSTGPATNSTNYMYVRSVKTAAETSAGPSSLASAWSNGVAFNMVQPVPTNSSQPTLTGTAQVGQTVTFGVGSWNNAPTSYSLRLYRGTAGVLSSETLIKDAGNVTSSTYVIQSSDAGYYLRAFATATNAGGTSNSGAYTPGQEIGAVTVPLTGPSGGSVSVNPTTGNAGSTTYTASISGWSGNPASFSATYSWQYLNTSFSWTQYATGSTFSPPASLPTAYAWQVVATVSNGVSPNGTASASFTVNAPLAVKPSGGSVSLNGTASIGQTLSASTSGWSGSPTSYDTRIVRGTAGVIIQETLVASSTTSSTSYVVQAADAGYYFKAFAAASNSAGTSDFAASSEKGPVPSPPPAGTAPSAPGSVTATYSSGPSWACKFNYSSSGTNPITYNWYFYSASTNTGSGQTLVDSGTVIASSYNSTYTVGNKGNGGTGYFWGKLVVTASNSYGSATADSGWN